MSLKAIHIAFITLSAMMFFGIAAARASVYIHTGELAAAAQAAGSVIAGGALVYYGLRFLKKFKAFGYL